MKSAKVWSQNMQFNFQLTDRTLSFHFKASTIEVTVVVFILKKYNNDMWAKVCKCVPVCVLFIVPGLHWHRVQTRLESIPVGCVPVIADRCVHRVCVQGGGCVPPRLRHLQKDWQMPVKTLPIHNYCCGMKNVMRRFILTDLSLFLRFSVSQKIRICNISFYHPQTKFGAR